MAKSPTKVVNGFLFPSADTECNRAVFYEAGKIAQIAKLCKNHRVAVQAGGNVGVFPVHLAKIFSQVYTFEPDFDNYRCLNLNIDGLNLNIEAVRAGLGVVNGTGQVVRRYEDNCGAHEVVDGEGVDVVALDNFFELDDDIDLIYLDVEGAEFRALLGAKMLIQRCKPVIVAENKGHMAEFPSNLDGNQLFRDWVCSLGYVYKMRLMRDDVFVPLED